MYLMTLASALALFASAAPAPAQDPQLPENNAGTGQYVEPVPDAGGDRPAGPGGQSGGGSTLPPETRSDLPPGEEGRILDRIASDPGSGAPEAAGGGADGKAAGRSGSGSDSRPTSLPADDEGPLSALRSAVLDSESNGAAIVLLLGLMGTVLALFAAVRRTRS
jgi:hypothetical protein